MQVEELQRRLRTQFDRLAAGLSKDEVSELEQFINGLSVRGDETLAKLTKRLTGKAKPANAKPGMDASAKVASALEAFRNLEGEIGTWSAPDYHLVRSRVSSICEPLSKSDLAGVSEVLLGKRNTSLTKAKMISQLSYRPIRQLELRFMNVNA